MNSFSINFLLKRTTTVLAVVILTMTLIAAITGILIAYYYQPTAQGAYNSLTSINETIPYGWLVYSLHDWAGNGLIVVALIQLVVMFIDREFKASWLTGWIGNILLTLSAIALGWTAMILAWNQLGYWRLKIELSTIESIPLIGETVKNILTGGNGINTDTIIHFSTIHSYILPPVAIALSLLHLIALVIREQEQKALILQQLENLVASTDKKREATVNK